MTFRPLLSRLLFAATLAVGTVACEEPPPAPMPAASAVALEGAALGPRVEGSIAGRAFRATDARFRAYRGEGRERVDLYLSDRSMARCGLPLARPDTRVWVRVVGRSALEPGELSTEDEAVEVHYERPGAEGIEAIHRGVGRLAIEEASAARVTGALRICFADAEGSCVGGRFAATPCLSRVDGRAIREPPGLSDEALEAVGEAP